MAYQVGGWYWDPKAGNARQFTGSGFGAPGQVVVGGNTGNAGSSSSAASNAVMNPAPPPPPPPPPPDQKSNVALDEQAKKNNVLAQNAAIPVGARFGQRDANTWRFSGGVHTGTDYLAVNKPVYVPQGNWRVVEAYNGAGQGYIGNRDNRGYGNSVLIQNTATGERLRFSHLSNTPLQAGQTFGGGMVGTTGNSGNTSGPHLDLEYYDPHNKLADVTKSNYGNSIFSGTQTINTVADTQPNFSQAKTLTENTNEALGKLTQAPTPLQDQYNDQLQKLQDMKSQLAEIEKANVERQKKMAALAPKFEEDPMEKERKRRMLEETQQKKKPLLQDQMEQQPLREDWNNTQRMTPPTAITNRTPGTWPGQVI